MGGNLNQTLGAIVNKTLRFSAKKQNNQRNNRKHFQIFKSNNY